VSLIESLSHHVEVLAKICKVIIRFDAARQSA